MIVSRITHRRAAGVPEGPAADPGGYRQRLPAESGQANNYQPGRSAGAPWALCFFRMLAKRWLFVVERQKFQLSRPDRSAPKLLESIERALRFLDVRTCAELLLAAAEAAALPVPRELAVELEKLARN
jgi:hypothetical protein